MKKTVWTFGLISGAVSAAMMLGTIPFADTIGFDRGVIVGYTTMVLAGLFIFFGIRSYREQVGGAITFGKAFTVGSLITLISCVCYVITWEVMYFKLMPGFVEKYTSYAVSQLKASGATQQAIEARVRDMQRFKELYDNPLINAAITFIEPFPVGLVITLISSAVLRKKAKS